MTNEPQPVNETARADSTILYKKRFALVGVACGLALFFGTPPLVLQFHEGFNGNYSRQWVESFPDWVASSMLLLGMGGGVLIILVSSLFGVLIPSQVTHVARDGKKPRDEG